MAGRLGSTMQRAEQVSSVGNASHRVFGKCRVRISVGTPIVLADVLRDFLSPSRQLRGLYLVLDRFLPRPFQFIIH
jgi:hypothetical protein